MTPEQEHTFCKAAAMGVACGLTHRYEWLMNAMRAGHHIHYENFDGYETALYESFLAFEKSTAGDPAEAEILNALDRATFQTAINAWYAKGKS